jgi:hypothetical protein
LACNHLLPLKIFFHGIPNCQGGLPKISFQCPIQGQSIPIIIFLLLPNYNLPVVVKTDRPISRLGESISLNRTRRDAATRRRGRSNHPDVLNLPRQNGGDRNNRGKIKKTLPKKTIFRWSFCLLFCMKLSTRILKKNRFCGQL